jgi:hypothetical protein
MPEFESNLLGNFSYSSLHVNRGNRKASTSGDVKNAFHIHLKMLLRVIHRVKLLNDALNIEAGDHYANCMMSQVPTGPLVYHPIY